MVNIKITLRASEVKTFCGFINVLFLKSVKTIDVIDFYNLRYFVKKLFDKIYNDVKLAHQTKKPYNISININVYDSLLRLYNENEKEIDHPDNLLNATLYREILLQCDKQKNNLTGLKFLNLL